MKILLTIVMVLSLRTNRPEKIVQTQIRLLLHCLLFHLHLFDKIPSAVKGITSTSYFSAHFKNTTFLVMERKFLFSGDVLDLADLTDKAI